MPESIENYTLYNKEYYWSDIIYFTERDGDKFNNESSYSWYKPCIII